MFPHDQEAGSTMNCSVNAETNSWYQLWIDPGTESQMETGWKWRMCSWALEVAEYRWKSPPGWGHSENSLSPGGFLHLLLGTLKEGASRCVGPEVTLLGWCCFWRGGGGIPWRNNGEGKSEKQGKLRVPRSKKQHKIIGDFLTHLSLPLAPGSRHSAFFSPYPNVSKMPHVTENALYLPM